MLLRRSPACEGHSPAALPLANSIPLPPSVAPRQIERCREGSRQGRLYVTDGSMPDYEAQAYPQDAPGEAFFAESVHHAVTYWLCVQKSVASGGACCTLACHPPLSCLAVQACPAAWTSGPMR